MWEIVEPMTVHLPLRLFRCPGSGNRTTTPHSTSILELPKPRSIDVRVPRWSAGTRTGMSGTQAGFRTRSTGFIVHEVRIDFRREMDDFKYRLTRGSGRYRDLPDLSTDELSLRLVWL